SPFTVMFGRYANKFLDYSKVPLRETETENKDSIAEKIEYMRETLFPSVNELTEITNQKTRSKFDSTHKKAEIKPNTFVMIKKDYKPNKLESPNEGPYKVVQRTKNGTYVLQDLSGKLLHRNYTANQIISLSSNPESLKFPEFIDHMPAKTNATIEAKTCY
ncbi:hypothetical protein BB560_003721, partial [Smittium megazygosporum]